MVSATLADDGATRTVYSYCRLCEPHCGLSVTVRDDVIQSIRGDADNPSSQGYVCGKGTGMGAVVYSPDRVLHPLRRAGAPGEFTEVSWDDALDDIAARLRTCIRRWGGDSVSLYHGNPAAFAVSTGRWAAALMSGIGSTNKFSPTPQDTGSRFVANALLYGSPRCHAIPDVDCTDFLLIVGANPLVTHGSLLSVGTIRQKLRKVVDRGGRIVVVDPARTRTAEAFEHIAPMPDSDAWLLLAMIAEIFRLDLVDTVALRRIAEGVDQIHEAVSAVDIDLASRRTGLPVQQITTLARDFATARSAAAYGRIGTCRGSFPTLTNFLLDALNAVTGNLDRRGGAVFPKGLVDPAPSSGTDVGFGKVRSRVGDLPEVNGNLAWVLPQEITTPGRGQVHALLMCAGNPVLSTPGADDLVAALPLLDLHVSLDMFVNETNRFADYVLPVTTFLERDDALVVIGPFMPRPWAGAADKVIDPLGETRDEWWIYDQLLRRLGIAAPAKNQESLLREIVGGSGLTADFGLTYDELRSHPHGVAIDSEPPVGWITERVKFFSSGRLSKVQLAPAQILDEMHRLAGSPPTTSADYPLLLIGRRDLRRLNSWLDKTQPAARTRPPAALWLHPDDAAARGVSSGDIVELRTRSGSGPVQVDVTDTLRPGVMSYPHGWGHHGPTSDGDTATDGLNINRLIPNDLAAKESLSGMSHLDGIAAQVTLAR